MACKWRWALWRGAGPTVLLPGGGARLQRRHGNRSQEGQMGERLESVGPQDVWPGRFWNSFDSQRADNTVVVAFVAQLIIPFFFGTRRQVFFVSHVEHHPPVITSVLIFVTECTWLSEFFCDSTLLRPSWIGKFSAKFSGRKIEKTRPRRLYGLFGLVFWVKLVIDDFVTRLRW